VIFEYAMHQTAAINARGEFNGKPLYPQGHNDVMVLGYSNEDAIQGRNCLRPIACNTNIEEYVKEHFR